MKSRICLQYNCSKKIHQHLQKLARLYMIQMYTPPLLKASSVMVMKNKTWDSHPNSFKSIYFDTKYMKKNLKDALIFYSWIIQKKPLIHTLKRCKLKSYIYKYTGCQSKNTRQWKDIFVVLFISHNGAGRTEALKKRSLE